MTATNIHVPELLAPAGDFSKIRTAFHFGADAAYLGGNSFGLRAFAKNFSPEEMISAVDYAHSLGKKIFVTVNIYPYDDDFGALRDYLVFLEAAGVDACIMSDIGVIQFCRAVAPSLKIHVSTQANITNSHAAAAWASLGAERVILARELSFDQIAAIRDSLDPAIAIECFVHGAMCVSYSGRCLLSTFLTDRNSNRGECVQACRWQFALTEKSRPEGSALIATEDERGTYLLNSKDLNMLRYVDRLIQCGVDSFKIEGRMKTQYYVANTVNAYRRVIDAYVRDGRLNYDDPIFNEPDKCSNRGYTTGFFLGKRDDTINLLNSTDGCDVRFLAEVLDYDESTHIATIEQRNRFYTGDTLEILSCGESMNRRFEVTAMRDESGAEVNDARLVQQKLYLHCPYRLYAGDMLRSTTK